MGEAHSILIAGGVDDQTIGQMGGIWDCGSGLKRNPVVGPGVE